MNAAAASTPHPPNIHSDTERGSPSNEGGVNPRTSATADSPAHTHTRMRSAFDAATLSSTSTRRRTPFFAAGAIPSNSSEDTPKKAASATSVSAFGSLTPRSQLDTA